MIEYERITTEDALRLAIADTPGLIDTIANADPGVEIRVSTSIRLQFNVPLLFAKEILADVLRERLEQLT